MKALYDLSAPAKLNLFLHVTGRRADGYHLLQSIFMLIDWCDTLHFELRTDGQLSREDLTTPLPADDLVLRAARALQTVSASPLGAHIGVAKQVPAQAGMGGGSSDAATCLLALNRLWKLHLPLTQLQTIGLQLGADVPFFLGGHNAWVEGVGEQITALTLPTSRFVVIKPPQGLETGEIFAAPELQRATPAAILTGFAGHDAARLLEFSESGHNDLQPIAQQLCPAIAQAIQWLEYCGLSARMTGSGSAVFARLKEDAPQGFELPAIPPDWQARKCSSLAVHPLLGWAD